MQSQLNNKLHTLYLVSTPIGNLKDISYRAIDILKEVPLILVEEQKIGKKILNLLHIDLTNKKIIEINEHVEGNQKLFSSYLTGNKKTNNFNRNHNNKKTIPKQIIEEITMHESAAMISDGGTPIIADPGNNLIKVLIDRGIRIKHIAGASSILSGIVISGFDISSFYYSGFLPQNENLRKQAINKLVKIKEVILIMETPYRLTKLLQALKEKFKNQTPITIAFNLSTESEEVFRGSLEKALTKYNGNLKNRNPFVLIINNR